ncbi:MAG: aminotransferase class I/II-fold pyridoxal phosphate-dependent enzyme [Planctomycetota bacterium]
MVKTPKYEQGVRKCIEYAKQLQHRKNKLVKRMKKCRFDTISVHGLYCIEEMINNNQGSIIEPAYLSTSQAYRNSDELEAALAYLMPGWVYSRIANPTVYYLEETLSLLEGYGFDGGTSCLCTSSGMSAVFCATDPFLAKQSKAADEKINFVAGMQCYGGTFQQFSVRRMLEHGIEVRWVKNSDDLSEWESKIDDDTRFVYGEMPANPTLSVFDIEKVANIAHKNGIPLIVDSTVATPALCRPLIYGADIVVHSMTKSLTTSGLAVGGAIISRNNITTKIKNKQMRKNFALYLKQLPFRDYGPCISPMNALLALSDIRTLRSKMDFLSASTMKVAEFLESHPAVSQVDYLGLKTNTKHKLAKKYLQLVDSGKGKDGEINRYTHLMSFHVNGSTKDTRNVFDKLQIIIRATDLGRIKSVATIPAISTHQQQGEEVRKSANIPPTMIRLSVGAEDPKDIIADIEQALSIVKRSK